MPRTSRLLRLAATLIVATSAAAGAAVINPVIAPTRTSGVAPLAVMFDATGTTWTGHDHIDVFRELSYAWDFDDPSAGSWIYSGKNKNVAYGAVSAHVFDTPGTYTVSVNVTDGLGNNEALSQVIIVDDPDLVFAGTKTICVSLSGDFSGCPAGALQRTHTNWSNIGTYVVPGNRILLRRGDIWTSADRVSLEDSGPGIIGAYGVGAAPKLDDSSVSQEFLRIQGSSDWRIMDLAMHGESVQTAIDDECAMGANQNILFYRIEIRDTKNGIKQLDSSCDYYGQGAFHDSIFVVENDISGTTLNALYLAATHLAVMGNSATNSLNQHILRTGFSTPGVIQHNLLSDSFPAGHLLKLHGQKINGSGAHEGDWQENIIISDNHFRHPRGDFAVAIGPQSANSSPGTDEKLRKIVLERNWFEANDGNTAALVTFAAQDSLIRNNVVNLTGADWVSSAILINSKGIQSPSNVQVNNNTCYIGSLTAPDDSANCINPVTGATPNSHVWNNLNYAPGVQNSEVVANAAGAGSVIENNINSGTNPFASANPSSIADFELNPGSSAVDTGLFVASNLLDLKAGFRPADGNSSGTFEHDVGALELGADGTPPPSINRPDAPILLP